jgi:hypothetical protein
MMRRSLVLMLGTALLGCAYGFAGGGLPSELKTVAVLPFENRTSDPTMAQEANREVRDAVQSRLGLRGATEAQADVVVRGTVLRYEPDQPVSYRGTGTSSGGARGNDVEVSKRLLQLSLEVEMIQKSNGRNLLRTRTFSADAQYDPGRETAGRRDALEQLINRLIQEAQSQW